MLPGLSENFHPFFNCLSGHEMVSRGQWGSADEPLLETQRRRKMTKLRNMVGVAFVAMSLVTGFAINTAHAEDVCQVDPRLCDDEREIILERETIREQ